jgi:hypothetical protein
MAETPVPELTFAGICPDCGKREVSLPQALPRVGNDFDWAVRDYDGFRLFMLEELAARFPERTRWTPADMEVVLVEQLAALLDQLSDMLDRIAAERYLATARRPESVRRLLALIGYDAIRLAQAHGEINPAETNPAKQRALLEAYWFSNPAAMEYARRAGPREIFTQRRMVTLDDYANRMEDHPLVLRASATQQWGGSWFIVQVALINWQNTALDSTPVPLPDKLKTEIEAFHRERGLCLPHWPANPSFRSILWPYLEAYRMVGQEVILQDAIPVGIALSISLRVAPEYFQSEVGESARQALGMGPGGFFEPGRLRFGEDLHSSDLVQTLMALEGVAHVCINRFKRVGSQFADQTETGRIELKGLEIAVCDNDPAQPEPGYFRLVLHGGRLG